MNLAYRHKISKGRFLSFDLERHNVTLKIVFVKVGTDDNRLQVLRWREYGNEFCSFPDAE